jgi:hypothetical protein
VAEIYEDSERGVFESLYREYDKGQVVCYQIDGRAFAGIVVVVVAPATTGQLHMTYIAPGGRY